MDNELIIPSLSVWFGVSGLGTHCVCMVWGVWVGDSLCLYGLGCLGWGLTVSVWFGEFKRMFMGSSVNSRTSL